MKPTSLNHINMSERSGGRLDEQASPAEPNPSGDEQESPAEPSTSGDSHRGALHRASTNGNSYREHHSTGSYRESQTTDSYWESDERPRNSPWALGQVAAIISECSPSQLEDVLPSDTTGASLFPKWHIKSGWTLDRGLHVVQ